MVVTGGVVVGDGHIGKKSINPTLDEFIAAALVGVVMADNDGMVVVADVDNVDAVDVVEDNNPPVG